MKIDNTSLFFNSTIVSGSATCAWSTSIGQSKRNKCRIDDSDAIKEFMVGMNYKIQTDQTNLDISHGSSSRELLFFSIFEKVFINNVKIDDAKFILLFFKEHTASHEGRLLISYPNYAKYTNEEYNVNNGLTMSRMAEFIKCVSGCWFVYDISIKNQDELYFTAIVVDTSPRAYSSSSERAKHWDQLVQEDIIRNNGGKKLQPSVLLKFGDSAAMLKKFKEYSLKIGYEFD